MQKQPSILWLASWYPTKLDPFPGDFIQRHAKALALYYPVHVLHIAKDGDGVITSSELTENFASGKLTETIHYYHPPATGIGILDRLISTWRFLNAGKKLISEHVKKNPQLFIHVHVAMRHGLLAVWAKKKYDINYVLTEHWAGYNYSEFPVTLRPSKWFWIATKRIFSKANFFYPEVKRVGELVNETIHPIAYKPVSNTVDTSLFYQESNKTDPKSQFQFVHVSTLSYQKNIEGILDVIEKISFAKEAVHFTLVGPASPEIMQRVQGSPTLSRSITITGPLSYEQVAAQVRKSHCLLMFSRYENQPCVILEALCCGLPIISTRVGGIVEVVDSSNGLLIESENKDQLTQGIETMIRTYDRYDPASIAQRSASLYSFETIGAQILAYYKEDLTGYF